MNKRLLENVVDLDLPDRTREGDGRDVHDARTAIARVPEGFLDCLREPGFTSHEASTRPRAGAVLWALEELENAPPLGTKPPAPSPAKPPPPSATRPPPLPLPTCADGPDVAPEIEVVTTSTERPPFASLPEIDIGAAVSELRHAPVRPSPLPRWVAGILLACAATTVLVGWVAIVLHVVR